MKIKLPDFVRFLIAGAVFILNAVAIFGFQWYDGLIHHVQPVAYVVNAVISFLIGAISYGVLPTKAAVDETIKDWNNTTPTNTEGDSASSKSKGYWYWGLGFVLMFTGILFWYIQEM